MFLKPKPLLFPEVLLLSGLLLTGLFGCGPTRKLSRLKPPVNLISPDTLSLAKVEDSIQKILTLRQGIFSKVSRNLMGFSWFSAKMKIDIQNNQADHQELTAYVRIRKDSLIWINLTATLGLEVARILITPDSILVADRLDRTVYRRNLDYARDWLRITVNFRTLEDLLVGNPVYFNDSISQVVQTPSVVSFTCRSGNLVNRMDVFADDYLIQESHLSEEDSAEHRTCELTYGDFFNLENRNFPSRRRIFIENKTSTLISINVTKARFNIPESFPFFVPGSYEEK